NAATAGTMTDSGPNGPPASPPHRPPSPAPAAATPSTPELHGTSDTTTSTEPNGPDQNTPAATAQQAGEPHTRPRRPACTLDHPRTHHPPTPPAHTTRPHRQAPDPATNDDERSNDRAKVKRRSSRGPGGWTGAAGSG